MSKINKVKAATIKKPAEKTTPTNAPVTKSVASKPVIAKSIIAKAASSKPVIAKTIIAKAASSKPVAITPAADTTTKKIVKSVTTKPKAVKAVKVEKVKSPKLKMERDSFTMPKIEYAQIHVLKERLIKLGNPAKKSELLRAGIMQLTAMTDTALKAAMSKVPTIKTGRPNKK